MIELEVLGNDPIELEVTMPTGGGGITPIGTKQISITENGTTTENVYSYADAEITVNVPNTYTASDEGKVVNNGALTSQTSATYTENDTYDTTLIDEVTINVDTVNNQDKTIVPTESVQSITADDGYTGLGEVTVDGIPTNYVGSAVPRKSSADLTVSGATVDVPSGYYSASASKSVPSGSEGTPVATKGAVSNHSVDVTPSVTNTEGYIAGGTKNGTAVNVSASELVSGTKSISANGTEDVTNYASVSVSVSNTYTASDEGKVVDNGALVSQSSATYTENDTYDTTLINEVTVSVSGGSIGGLANMVDVTNVEYTIGYMLSQMKKGNTVGGTITYSSAFANTEQLILSTGLSEIHGFMFVCPTYDITTQVGGSGQSNKFYFFFRHSYESEPNHYFSMGMQQQGTTVGVTANHVLGTNYQSSPDNGTIRIDGGNIYYTARYNKNANYQIVRPNIEYEWLAW